MRPTDLRDVLPAVRVPTLVLYGTGWEEHALDVAKQIPAARATRTSASVSPRAQAVNIGARLAAAAEPGEILTSGTVRDVVAGAGLACEEPGD